MADTNGSKPKTAKKRKFSPGKLLAWCGAAAAIAIVCVTIGYVAIIINGKQFMEKYKDKMVMSEVSTMYDVKDQEIGVLLQGENRELVEYKDIPSKLANAFIATEDRRFDKHTGVDFWAVGRALVKDVVHRGAVEGGSTITQQLAKNMFLTYDKTFFRKATEASIALALESEFTKEEILTMYLNRIYFGKGAYGIKVAAKQYFGITDLNDLKIWQMATLAGIPKSPGNYNPVDNPDKSKERRGVVLKLMYDQGYITEQEKNEAMDVEYTPPPQQAGSNKDYQTFRNYVIKEAQEAYGIEEDQLLRGGYKIKTTMDANAQKIMEQAFDNKNLFPKDGPEQKSQGSMVIVNNKDGGIVAMIGGRDYVNKGLNRAVVQRQPGSSFKPIVVYAPALERGDFYPSSMLQDEEKDYNGYSPRNYDGVYRGEVDMAEAVRKSINAPAVWLLDKIGLNKGMQFAERMGITFDPKDKNLASALGGMTKGVTPLQMAQAYSAFANGGFLNKAHAIREIVDTNGETVRSFKGTKTKVMNPKTSYYMTQMLQGVVDSGTGTAAKMNRPTAGKTGTTQLDLKGLEKFNRDIWFAGYTPEWSAAVWMGFDKTDSKHYISSGTALPAAMFKEVMSKALAKVPVTSFPKPDGVDEVKETPKPAAGISLSAGYVKESRKVRLSWTNGDNNNGGTIQVFRKEAKEPDFKKILELNGGTEANDISVEPGKTYQYYVVPFNTQTGTAGDKSNVADVTVPQDGTVSPLPSLSPSPGSADPSGKPGENGKPAKPTPVPGQSGPAPTAKPTPGTTAQPPTATDPGAATQADSNAGGDGEKISIELPKGSQKKGSNDNH